MERDLDLIRKILQQIKECNSPHGLDGIPSIEGYENKVISYHIKILCDAAILEATPIQEMRTEFDDYFAINLTWFGQDFINAATDDTIWNKAKKTIIKPGASFTFDVLFEWLQMKAKEKIGLL